jgi:hypothetical protein
VRKVIQLVTGQVTDVTSNPKECSRRQDCLEALLAAVGWNWNINRDGWRQGQTYTEAEAIKRKKEYTSLLHHEPADEEGRGEKMQMKLVATTLWRDSPEIEVSPHINTYTHTELPFPEIEPAKLNFHPPYTHTRAHQRRRWREMKWKGLLLLPPITSCYRNKVITGVAFQVKLSWKQRTWYKDEWVTVMRSIHCVLWANSARLHTTQHAGRGYNIPRWT